jgi:DNA-binding FadR family transcriptional regulator
MSGDATKRLMMLMSDLGLREGAQVPTEAELVRHLGVSRQVVRESLNSLETLGIVVSRQGARRTLGDSSLPAIIRHAKPGLTLDIRELSELLEVRRVLEAAFFPIAAASFSSSTITSLRSLTDRMVAKAEDGLTSLEEDAIFHRRLYDQLGNEVLLALVETFWDVFNTVNPFERTRKELVEIAESHVKIVDAIEARDMALAAHALNTHFFEIRARLARAGRNNPQ